MKPSTSLTTSISSAIAGLNNQVSQQNQQATIALIQKSIADVGQLVPIVMNGTEIIDGHKRQQACANLKIQPKTVQVSSFGNGNSLDEIAIWVSLNLGRGHLNPNELALIALELYRLRPLTPEGRKVSQEQICQNIGVSDDTVRRIKKAQQLAQALGQENVFKERIQLGHSAHEVVRDMQSEKIKRLNLKTNCDTNLKVAQELHAMAESTLEYEVIYADPPWAEACPDIPYDTMPTGKDGDVPNADGTYPTVCSMAGDIRKLAARNSVLWLWTTSSLVQNGLKVMETWGFKYTTMIVWAKDHANTTRGAVKPKHELILVGEKIKDENGQSHGADQDIVLIGKRGSGLKRPEHIEQIESWVELPVRKYAHSEKPEEFAAMAEHLYPTKTKLELFARRARTGWTCWGNQSDGKALAQAKARSGGHQSNKSATAGMVKHQGRKPGKQVVVQPVAQTTEQHDVIEQHRGRDEMLARIGK